MTARVLTLRNDLGSDGPPPSLIGRVTIPSVGVLEWWSGIGWTSKDDPWLAGVWNAMGIGEGCFGYLPSTAEACLKERAELLEGTYEYFPFPDHDGDDPLPIY